jgi:hypothetical protein
MLETLGSLHFWSVSASAASSNVEAPLTHNECHAT